MFKVSWKGRPQPAERARPRFSKNKDSYYMYNPPSYQKYQKKLIDFFSKYSDDPELKKLFDKKRLIYGLSVKIVFRLVASTGKNQSSTGKNPFYGKRPDIDNLYKAVVDALFLSKGNQIEDGFLTDADGEPIVDSKGDSLIKYKQKIDDSRVIHTELLKLRVDDEDQEGFTIIVRNVGREDIS